LSAQLDANAAGVVSQHPPAHALTTQAELDTPQSPAVLQVALAHAPAVPLAPALLSAVPLAPALFSAVPLAPALLSAVPLAPALFSAVPLMPPLAAAPLMPPLSGVPLIPPDWSPMALRSTEVMSSQPVEARIAKPKRTSAVSCERRVMGIHRGRRELFAIKS